MIPIMMLALLQATAAAPDPLAPAREGKLQCTLPDRVKKTCLALSRYVPDGDRRYLNITRSLMGTEPDQILEFKSPTVIEGGAACGIMARSEMDEAVLYIGGVAAPRRSANHSPTASSPRSSPTLARKRVSASVAPVTNFSRTS